ncbi:MAG: LAGLIDADG family homing endonuclease [Candidatus Niyogibacteria bacterium]|nr:LAGLIDADG family homing endonuclease [Candidatus Niyogibacteria bacterium]
MKKLVSRDKKLRAYIVGLALGDGNLSNPNGRAVRLRITCDKRYKKLLHHIAKSLQRLFPDNSVNIVNQRSCADVSVYSNHLPKLLEWRWDGGPKDKQNVAVPPWIKQRAIYTKECLRGLLQTDGSLYHDRGYPMINFVNTCETLAHDAFSMMRSIGYSPTMQKLEQSNKKIKHTIRLSKNVHRFVDEIKYWKA